MRRRRMFLLVALAAGLLAVTGSGAGADTASRSPYDFVLAYYTVGDGSSVFINAWTRRNGGRTHGVIKFSALGQKNRVCIRVQGNEAYVEHEFRIGGGYLWDRMFLRDNSATGEPDEFDGLDPPQQGRVSRVCPDFDGFGKGLRGILVVSGDINIHDG